MKRICLILLCISLFLHQGMVVKAEEDLTPTAKSAILIDYATGEVLYEKNADERLAPGWRLIIWIRRREFILRVLPGRIRLMI